MFHVPPSGTISDRAELLLKHAKKLRSSGTLPADLVDMREHRFKNLSEGYFLLNRAYKTQHMPDGHFTEPTKIAALQAVAISRFQPFFPLKTPVDEDDIASFFPNEIFALYYALGVIEVDFVPDTPEKEDFWFRLLEVIKSARVQTLEDYSTDKTMRIDRPLTDYERDEIHPDDRATIAALISIFELMSKKRSRLLGPETSLGRLYRWIISIFPKSSREI